MAASPDIFFRTALNQRHPISSQSNERSIFAGGMRGVAFLRKQFAAWNVISVRSTMLRQSTLCFKDNPKI
jgi:hypothetical protein